MCSFAQLELKKHGDPKWHDTSDQEPTYFQKADDGKVELSLMHFAVTNPKWPVPKNEDKFLASIKVFGYFICNAIALRFSLSFLGELIVFDVGERPNFKNSVLPALVEAAVLSSCSPQFKKQDYTTSQCQRHLL